MEPENPPKRPAMLTPKQLAEHAKEAFGSTRGTDTPSHLGPSWIFTSLRAYDTNYARYDVWPLESQYAVTYGATKPTKENTLGTFERIDEALAAYTLFSQTGARPQE